jgi:hypothetical protein
VFRPDGGTVPRPELSCAEAPVFRDVKVTYGAAGNGTTADRTAFVNANAAGGTIYVPVGTYRIESNLTLTSDLRFEQGAVLKPDAGVTITLEGQLDAGVFRVFDLGNSGSRIVVKRVERMLVQWWGAAGDGSTDDRAAIQAAIDAAADVGGGVVYFPRGRYRITSAVKLDTTVHRYGSLIFRGEGWDFQSTTASTVGSVIQYDATSGSALELGPSTGGGNPLFNFMMYDLAVMAMNTGYTGNLVKAYALGKCGFYNCGFGGMPEATSATVGALFYGNFWVDLHVERCHFGTAVKGVQKANLGTGFGDSVDNVSFVDCLFYRCNTSLDIQGNAQSVAIDRTTFEPAISGAASQTILIGDSSKVQNCWFGDGDGTGTWLQVGGAAARVTGNYVAPAAVGVYLNAAYDAEVSSNYFDHCSTAVQAATAGLKMRGNFIYVANGTSSIKGLGLDLTLDTSARVECNRMMYDHVGEDDPAHPGQKVPPDNRFGYKLASGTRGVLDDLESDASWGNSLVQNSAGSAWVTLLPSLGGTTLKAPNVVSAASTELQGFLTMTGSAGSPSTSTRFISDAGSTDTFYHNVPAGGAFLFADAGSYMLQLSRGAAADDDTAMILMRRQSGTWSAVRVSEGAANSGGTGYRLLRVPN